MTASPMVTGWLKKEEKSKNERQRRKGGCVKMKVETKEYRSKGREKISKGGCDQRIPTLPSRQLWTCEVGRLCGSPGMPHT